MLPASTTQSAAISPRLVFTPVIRLMPRVFACKSKVGHFGLLDDSDATLDRTLGKHNRAFAWQHTPISRQKHPSDSDRRCSTSANGHDIDPR